MHFLFLNYPELFDSQNRNLQRDNITDNGNEGYEHKSINYFWNVKNSLEVLDKLKAFENLLKLLWILISLLFILHYHIILLNRNSDIWLNGR